MPRSHRKRSASTSKSSHHRPVPLLGNNLAAAQNLQKQGRLPQAEAAYKRILKIDKYCVSALAGLGSIKHQRGDFVNALKLLRRALKYDPSNHTLRLGLAKTYLAQGDISHAEMVSKQALVLESSFEGHCLQAEIYDQLDDPVRAITAYKSALVMRGDVAEIHNNLGLIYRRQHNFGDALERFDRALEINPYSLAAHNNRGNTLKDLGDYDGAIREYMDALDLNPKNIDALYNLALCHQQNGDMLLALKQLEEIVEIAPNHELAGIQIIESLISLGRFVDADSALDELLSERPHSAQAWFLKASIHQYQCFEPTVFTPIIDFLNDDNCDRDASVWLNFALGKLFDDIGDHDRAFSHYELGNRTRQQQSVDDPTIRINLTAALLNSRAADWQPHPDHAGDDTPDLIFIVGMPRSGTTLVEQILSAHAGVTAAGEVEFFGAALHRLALAGEPSTAMDIDLRSLTRDDCTTLKTGYLTRLNAIAPGGSTIIDKTPANFNYLGLIQRLFPSARIVRCIRHPLDTCLSIYFQLFDSIEYAHDFSAIGDQYVTYEAIMAHWRETLDLNIFELHYERLVACPEESIQALLEHCALPFDAACLTPHNANRSINTMSRWQARQPLYRHAVHRWQRYDKHLGALKRRLGSVLLKYPDATD